MGHQYVTWKKRAVKLENICTKIGDCIPQIIKDPDLKSHLSVHVCFSTIN